MIHPRFVLLLCCLTVLPITAAAQVPTSDAAAVRQLLAEFRGAFDRADAAAYERIHAANTLVVDLGIVSHDRAALVKNFRADLAGPDFKGFKFTRFDITNLRFPTPSTAIVTVPWEASLPNQPTMKGVALLVAGKHGRTWLLDAWHSALVMP